MCRLAGSLLGEVDYDALTRRCLRGGWVVMVLVGLKVF